MLLHSHGDYIDAIGELLGRWIKLTTMLFIIVMGFFSNVNDCSFILINLPQIFQTYFHFQVNHTVLALALFSILACLI